MQSDNKLVATDSLHELPGMGNIPVACEGSIAVSENDVPRVFAASKIAEKNLIR